MISKEGTLIVITGPTASGKSALAVKTAKRLQTEIISADSRQIYQGIPIVTAMPTDEERATVPHHLIDMLPLESYYSAAEFEQDALQHANRLINEYGTAVVCGGSMMYVDSLCHGIDELPTVPSEIRNQLQEDLILNGPEWLREQLRTIDPIHYRRVDLNNIKRVFHAVEISLTAGKPYSSLLTGTKRQRPFKIIKICLEMPREKLFERINQRVDKMILDGLEEESRSVFEKRHLNSLNTVGLKEMFAYFDNTLNRITAIERIKKNTRVYAKKQITWFKRDSEIIRIDPFSQNVIEEILNLL